MEKSFGLIGERLGHTYSPMIHRHILKAMNIEGNYAVMEVTRERLGQVIPELKASGYAGVNVTIPYKTEIMAYLDEISPEAEKIGAVNVISLSGSKATGYNTDYYGFGMMLSQGGIDVGKKRVLVLGSGGASRAAVRYLRDSGAADILVAARNKEAAAKVYPDLGIVAYDDIGKIYGDLIVNCTPVGMHPNIDSTPAGKEVIANFHAAADLIYNPLKTRFILTAQSLGKATVNGLYMLVAQAVKSQEIWNNTTLPPELILKIMESIREKL